MILNPVALGRQDSPLAQPIPYLLLQPAYRESPMTQLTAEAKVDFLRGGDRYKVYNKPSKYLSP